MWPCNNSHKCLGDDPVHLDVVITGKRTWPLQEDCCNIMNLSGGAAPQCHGDVDDPVHNNMNGGVLQTSHACVSQQSTIALVGKVL